MCQRCWFLKSFFPSFRLVSSTFNGKSLGFFFRDRQTERERERQTETDSERQTDRQIKRESETDRQIVRETDKQRERETNRERERERETFTLPTVAMITLMKTFSQHL